jgi:hypothetical protein
VHPAAFGEQPVERAARDEASAPLDLILDVTVPVTVSIGTVVKTVSEILSLALDFVADLLMVLVIEIQRGAVMQTVEQAQTLSKGLLSFHIFVSVTAMVLWVFQLVVGAKLLKGAPLLPRHRALAVGFLVCRLTNVVTAFYV